MPNFEPGSEPQQWIVDFRAKIKGLNAFDDAEAYFGCFLQMLKECRAAVSNPLKHGCCALLLAQTLSGARALLCASQAGVPRNYALCSWPHRRLYVQQDTHGEAEGYAGRD